jgi:hypothetical protein
MSTNVFVAELVLSSTSNSRPCIHANDSVELKFRAALDGAVTNLTFNRLFVMQGRLFDVELSTSSATKTFVDIAWN